jgi:hypothetical protein
MISFTFDLDGYRSVYVCEHCMVSYTSDEVFGSEEFALLNGGVERALHLSLPHVLSVV